VKAPGSVEDRVQQPTSPAPPRRIELGREELDAEALEIRRWEESAERSRERRETAQTARADRRRWTLVPLGVAVATVVAVAVAMTEPLEDGAAGGGRADRADRANPGAPPPAAHRAAVLPGHQARAAARTFARSREGPVSFAVVDTRGEAHGFEVSRRYVSASVVKSMLLAAELRRLDVEGVQLDAATEQTLRAMITYSDNDAADSIYYRVGDEGLYEVARAAGMERFDVYGYWANAQIAAADMARMFTELDGLMPDRFREFGLGLLGSVIPEQSWGIPAAAGERWAVRFKGGWRSTESGQLIHQVAELRDGDRLLSIAVLTDGQPTQAYGIETVRGIAQRLLAAPERAKRPSSRRASSARLGS
jgi:Beta-lactamase enzyme family